MVYFLSVLFLLSFTERFFCAFKNLQNDPNFSCLHIFTFPPMHFSFWFLFFWNFHLHVDMRDTINADLIEHFIAFNIPFLCFFFCPIRTLYAKYRCKTSRKIYFISIYHQFYIHIEYWDMNKYEYKHFQIRIVGFRKEKLNERKFLRYIYFTCGDERRKFTLYVDIW